MLKTFDDLTYGNAIIEALIFISLQSDLFSLLFHTATIISEFWLPVKFASISAFSLWWYQFPLLITLYEHCLSTWIFICPVIIVHLVLLLILSLVSVAFTSQQVCCHLLLLAFNSVVESFQFLIGVYPKTSFHILVWSQYFPRSLPLNRFPSNLIREIVSCTILIHVSHAYISMGLTSVLYMATLAISLDLGIVCKEKRLLFPFKRRCFNFLVLLFDIRTAL